MSSIRTRIAPSPTGDDLHVGSLATALVNYAVAKKHDGTFVVRIEDTDRTRFVEGAEEKFLQVLAAYGIAADESPQHAGEYGPYRQSERLDIYKKHAELLIEKGAAYYCTCTRERLSALREEQQRQKHIPRYDKHCLTRQDEVQKQMQNGVAYVVRLNVPASRDISFEDMLRGTITISTNDLDDQVLMKSDGFPTYHLAVVIDDYLMKISHVIRAEEWISSTPKHVLLYESFGWELPVFAHVPLLRNADKSKLSKRKNPVWASSYLEDGILPNAMLNYLALMGWSHPDEKEVFDLEEYIRVFDLKDMQPVGPVFDPVKLSWMNGEHIRLLPAKDFQMALEQYLKQHQTNEWKTIEEKMEVFAQSIPLVQPRIRKLSEYYPMCRFFYEDVTEHEIDLGSCKDILTATADALEQVSDWTAEQIGEAMQHVCSEGGAKPRDYFQQIRVAITGRKVSPPLNESMEILGKDTSLSRLRIS